LSTTVTCELRVQPGHVDEILQRSTEQFSLPSHSVVGRRHARLYQHLNDPCRLLYVGEWESRRAVEAYRMTAPMPGRPDQFVQMPAFRYYRRLALFEHVLLPFDVVYVNQVTGPAETHAARRDLAVAYHREAARARLGLTLLMTNECTDDVQGLLLISGWRLHAPANHAKHSTDESLMEQLRATGGVVNRFVGRQLIETGGAARLR
jgi:quinol monooxygenase YgiN